MSSAKVNVSFGDWLRLSCEYGGMLLQMVGMGVVMLACLMLPILGRFFAAVFGVAFLLTLRHAWLRDQRNPPWYLVEHAREVRGVAKATDD